MRKIAALLLAMVAWSAAASAQTVQQSGTITPGHASTWIVPGVIKDGGPAVQGNITELGITKNGGLPFCITTGAPTSPAYDQLCMGVSLNGQGFISLTPYGTATPIPLNLIINGVTYSIGGTNWLSGIFDQQFGSTPGDLVCRGPSGWIALPPGASGLVLQTQGSGGCPAWASSTVLTTPALRVVASGSSDTAGTTDNSIVWESTTTAAKAQAIPACNAGLKGKTFLITDGAGTATLYHIVVTPTSGTIGNTLASLSIDSDGASASLQCDGNSNWESW